MQALTFQCAWFCGVGTEFVHNCGIQENKGVARSGKKGEAVCCAHELLLASTLIVILQVGIYLILFVIKVKLNFR